MNQEEFDKEIEKLKKHLELYPEDEESHLILGKFYFLNKRYAEAVETYRKLLSFSDGNVSAYYNLAVACEAKKDYKEAKKNYRKVLEFDQDNKDAQEALNRITTFQ
jgi:tetratricopeptide (TPR) repeat protein